MQANEIEATEINERLRRLTDAEAAASADPDHTRRAGLRTAIRAQWHLIKPFAVRHQRLREIVTGVAA